METRGEDLSGVVHGAGYSPRFATAQLPGYFDGEPPCDFFQQLTFYIARGMLSSICRAAPVGQVEVEFYLAANKMKLKWHDNMRSSVPSWYLR